MLMSDTTPTQVEQWLDKHAAPVASPRESLQTTGWRLYRRGKSILTRKPGSAYL